MHNPSPLSLRDKGALVAPRAKTSSIWTKITSLLGGKNLDLYAVILGAILVLIIKGASGQGQTIFSNILRHYAEETSASIANIVKSPNQIAELNSLEPRGSIIGQGGPENDLPPATIQDNSIVAYNPSSKDYIESVGFKRNQVIEYTVQPGDRLSFIASDYGVSINTILWANNLKDADSISPEQVLKIPPVSGIVYKIKKGDTLKSIAQKYSVDEDKIIDFNDLPQSGQLAVDDEIILPDGKPKRTSPNGVVQTTISKLFSYLPDLGSFFAWPTSGYNWGKLHGRNGVDIANSCGTPIYVSASGSVIVTKDSGWNGGFGKYIKVAHPNGTETLYAHLSKVIGEVGEDVSQGQLIGLMGTTGHSTGCHLHFEVHGARNPLAKY